MKDHTHNPLLKEALGATREMAGDENIGTPFHYALAFTWLDGYESGIADGYNDR